MRGKPSAAQEPADPDRRIIAPRRIRDEAGETSHFPTKGERQELVPSGKLDSEIARVAGEELISSDPRQGDGHLTTSIACHQVGEDERRVREGLVEMPDQLGEKIRDVWMDEELPVIGLEPFGNLASPFCFAERMLLKI